MQNTPTTKLLLVCGCLTIRHVAVGASLDTSVVNVARKGSDLVPPAAQSAVSLAGQAFEEIPSIFISLLQPNSFVPIATPTAETNPAGSSSTIPVQQSTTGGQLTSRTSAGTTAGDSSSTRATAGSSTWAAFDSPTPPMTSESKPQSTASTTSNPLSSNHTLIISLTATASVLGFVLVLGTVFGCYRYRQKRARLFRRGITPIDDEEIESWKVSPEERNEKRVSVVAGAAMPRSGPRSSEPRAGPGRPSTGTKDGMVPGAASEGNPTTPTKKVPSAVIVYQNQPSGSGQPHQRYRQSEELSPRSVASSAGFGGSRCGTARASMEKDFPQTPLQARAPNAREGLTDESIPGDEPFIPLPKRQPSRLSKLPGPLSSPRPAHTRARSSRSSTRSFGLGWDSQYNNPYSGYGYYGGGSEQELHRAMGRASSDYPRESSAHGCTAGYSMPYHNHRYPYYHHHHQRSSTSNHSRVYSTSSVPPRLSFSDDLIGSPRPLLREDIGRAIG